MLETDPHFPSGPWTGFFLQKLYPGRHPSDLGLRFENGAMTGAGADWVGTFTVTGRYDIATGECHWSKRYAGKHDVFYRGFNEGKGIWGVWEIGPSPTLGHAKGGFHIWPEGMIDPSVPRLSEEEDVPAEVDETVVVVGSMSERGS